MHDPMARRPFETRDSSRISFWQSLSMLALCMGSLQCSAAPDSDRAEETGGTGSTVSATEGGSAAIGGTHGGESVAAAATFDDVKGILSAQCATCHNGSNTRVDLRDNEGLYARLTSEMGSETKCASNTLVVPGDPDASVLVAITSSTKATPCSVRMPMKCSLTDTTARSCLDEDQLAAFSAWIAAGAPE